MTTTEEIRKGLDSITPGFEWRDETFVVGIDPRNPRREIVVRTRHDERGPAHHVTLLAGGEAIDIKRVPSGPDSGGRLKRTVANLIAEWFDV